MLESGLGCFVYERKLFRDSRGYFSEVFKESDYPNVPKIKQINVASSKAGVVRGFHLQKVNPQGKLIRVLSGEAVACILDLRNGSPTFGHTECFVLNEDTKSLYVPPGFGNSYWALSDTVYHYACTEEYDAASDCGVNPLDEQIDFPWRGKDVLISEKDKKLPLLKDFFWG